MSPLFEVSWEVCNKVGGIYTVIESKSEYIKKNFREYYAVGPYFPFKKNKDFEERVAPKNLAVVFERLKKKNINCVYGIWTLTKAPAILVDFRGLMDEKNKIKASLWQDFKVDSIFARYDFDEPLVWSTAVGMLLEEVSNQWNKSILAQFHEWLSGGAILYLKKANANVHTVFTTHATVLERSIASTNDTYSEVIDPDKEAVKRNIQEKHTLEKASALNADIFTTVSELVAKSSQTIFKRKPEVIVTNGINLKRFPKQNNINSFHKKNKEKIKDFLRAFFFPSYYFDLDNTLFYFISGRYEYNAKGIDVFIKALSLLNTELKKQKKEKKVVAFFLIPSAKYNENISLAENIVLLKDIKNKIRECKKSKVESVLDIALSGKEINCFDESASEEINKLIRIFKKNSLPILSTHDLQNPQEDSILNELKKQGLENKEEDPVKIVFYPSYVEENDGIMNLDYYSLTSGMHLGIFPSFYEPWGYTPVESACLGVPSITTDLSGFGQYVQKNMKLKNKDERGIIILKRKNKTSEESSKSLAENMKWYLNLTKEKRIKNKIIAEKFICSLSWERLIQNYLKAYSLALKKRK
ncbi:MAG: glycogen/starch synthase [Candidatus Nanoarchaeia archaeon]